MKSGVKQDCVLAPTLFGIFFSASCPMPLTLPLTVCTLLFSVARLRAKTKVKTVLVLDMLFADDAALETHSPRQQCSGLSTNSAVSVKTLASQSASRKPM